MSETQIEQLDGESFDDQPGEPDGEPPITEEDALEGDQEAGNGEFIDQAAALPEAPRGLTEAEIEKLYRELTKEQKRHDSALTRIFGDDVSELVTCPFCEPELAGYLRVESLDHPRDEMHEAMIAVLKKPAQVNYKEAPNSVECHDCDGLGKVLSGSRVPGKELIACATCSGAGNLVQGGSQQNGLAIPPGSEYVPSGLEHEPLEEERDEFGSPAYLPNGQENPNYGKTMRHKDPAIERDYLERLSGVR
jgi:hypothetical protein